MTSTIGGPGEWVAWSEAGDLVFVAGPMAGRALGDVVASRLMRVAKRLDTPPATRRVLTNYARSRESRRPGAGRGGR